MLTPAQQALIDRFQRPLNRELGLDDEPLDRHCDVPRAGLSWDENEADRAGSFTRRPL